jgi:hypothetical protein
LRKNKREKDCKDRDEARDAHVKLERAVVVVVVFVRLPSFLAKGFLHPMLKRRTHRFSLPVLSLRPAISAGDLVNR